MNNLVWVKCKQWQDWINVQDIELGQPMLKNDKSSAMLELEDRCKFVTYAHPKLRGFDPEKERYYLPVSLNQVMVFFNCIMPMAAITVQYNKWKVHIKLKSSLEDVIEGKGPDWHEACSKLLKEVFNV